MARVINLIKNCKLTFIDNKMQEVQNEDSYEVKVLIDNNNQVVKYYFEKITLVCSTAFVCKGLGLFLDNELLCYWLINPKWKNFKDGDSITLDNK